MIRTDAETAVRRANKQAKKAKSAGPTRKPGRPTGSRNNNKADGVLNPELQRIQKMLHSLPNTVQGTLHLTYPVLDGHFGKHPAFHIVRRRRLHLISKLRTAVAVSFP